MYFDVNFLKNIKKLGFWLTKRFSRKCNVRAKYVNSSTTVGIIEGGERREKKRELDVDDCRRDETGQVTKH
jgi:ABC-type thiamine transport system substrate-binding protein